MESEVNGGDSREKEVQEKTTLVVHTADDI